MIPDKKRKELYKQGYRIVGNHSAIKICAWTKNSLRNRGACYKNTFYGIQSWRCVQMTPALQHCNFRCWHCWRDIATASRQWTGPVDSPEEIVEGCIREHVKMLLGFGGNPNVNVERFSKIKMPLHFAISLTGEPTMYPRMADLIDEIKKRGMTAYLVTNGSYPETVRSLIGHEPTQFYITLAAPYKELFEKTTNPLTKHAWERFNKTLELMEHLNTRRVLRLTLTKGYNMQEPEQYGKFIKNLHFDYVECKGYMNVGYSKQRLSRDNQPLHDEIVDFSTKLAKAAGLKIVDQRPESSVALLMKEDSPDRIMAFEADIKKEASIPQEILRAREAMEQKKEQVMSGGLTMIQS